MAVIVEVYDNGSLVTVRVADGERWEVDGGQLDVFALGSGATRKRVATFADRAWRSVTLDEPTGNPRPA